MIPYSNIGYNLSTHADIEKISFIPYEREVLFFPFSSFEIKDIKEVYNGNENIYEIKLLYLGKYLKDIENDKNIIINENKIPDNEFKKQLYESGLIKKEKIQNINTKILYNIYKQYENDINNNKNIIISEINIKPEDINKDLHIINSFENMKRENKIKNKEDDWKYENEKEIKESIEIKVDEKIIPFSYYYKFEKEGKYAIKYKFKNNLTKINHLFYECKSLINIDLSNFNTENVINMSSMFSNCISLTNLNLSNINTENVINMSELFYVCESLISIDLSSFNTRNVNNMSMMFYGCESLVNLNLSNFNTKNVTNMNGMFWTCNSLTNINLLNFNTQNVKNMSWMFGGCNSLNKNKLITNDDKILKEFDKK